MSIYVGNLSYDVTQEDLSAVFAEYGSVKRVQLPTDRETGRLRGFAFVEMGTEAEEAAAIEALDGAEWMGRDMTEVRLVVVETGETTTFHHVVTKIFSLD
jgi:RNA recognition motif-containing protein